MRCVLLLFDSLNRLAISPYAKGIDTPNFDRLAQCSTTFERHYVGSLPCMPARRDLHTGRLSFFHRSWGPLEPFDNSLPEILRARGVYTHLATDHYHYWEDGGATYHNRYDSYDMIRGQERDPWTPLVDPPVDDWAARFHPKQVSAERGTTFHNYLVNRDRMVAERHMPVARTMEAGLDFIARNHMSDDWFLQIETFDPHEPFFTLDEPGTEAMPGPIFDWPPYAKVSETAEQVAQLRARYHALVKVCDAQLGRLLDRFDAEDMWDDTALLVSTDHGFLLGEHDWWAKNRMYAYEEISHIPLMAHVPGVPDGGRSAALTQTIDLMPTILDLFGVDVPDEVTGRSALPGLDGTGIRETAIFGYFGGGINVTDGRYTFFWFPEDLEAEPLFQYTLMPTHMKSFFDEEELRRATHGDRFDFTKGMALLKVPLLPGTASFAAHGPGSVEDRTTVLFDLVEDPGQTRPLRDPGIEGRLTQWILAEMRRHDAPPEAFRRFATDDRSS